MSGASQRANEHPVPDRSQNGLQRRALVGSFVLLLVLRLQLARGLVADIRLPPSAGILLVELLLLQPGSWIHRFFFFFSLSRPISFFTIVALQPGGGEKSSTRHHVDFLKVALQKIATYLFTYIHTDLKYSLQRLP